MSTSQDQNGTNKREPHLRCCGAQRDLEPVIGGVLLAEGQIKLTCKKSKPTFTATKVPSLGMPSKP